MYHIIQCGVLHTLCRVALSVVKRYRPYEPSKGLVSQSLSSKLTYERERWLTRLLLRAQNAFERKRSAHKAQNMTLFVAKCWNTKLFCRDMLKYGTLCRKNLDSTLWAGMGWYERTPHFMQLCDTVWAPFKKLIFELRSHSGTIFDEKLKSVPEWLLGFEICIRGNNRAKRSGNVWAADMCIRQREHFNIYQKWGP